MKFIKSAASIILGLIFTLAKQEDMADNNISYYYYQFGAIASA